MPSIPKPLDFLRQLHTQISSDYNTARVDQSMATLINLLTPNFNYSGRTAPLTSKVAFYIFIQQV